MPVLYDKTGRPIESGDILKVFHFTGSRRKAHYMYKQALEYSEHPKGGTSLRISHLNRLADEKWEIGKNYYIEIADDRVLAGYEIVDSLDASFDMRPRKVAAEHEARVQDLQNRTLS